MSSVWLTTADDKKNPRKMAGNLSPRDAMRYLRKQVLAFVTVPVQPAGEHSIKNVGTDTVLLFAGDELRASLHVEHLSPPTKAGAGDNWVKEAH